jgi:hypothetical protein
VEVTQGKHAAGAASRAMHLKVGQQQQFFTFEKILFQSFYLRIKPKTTKAKRAKLDLTKRK